MDLEKDISQCLNTLHAGGIILYPTDTVWGLGCDATNPAAAERIFQLKNRPSEKSMIVLVADPKDILTFTSQPHPSVFEFLKKQQQPTTVVYQGMINLAPNLSQDGTVAIRLTEDPFCRQLIKRFRRPIVSTSANLSGSPSPANFSEIDDVIRRGVDYVVTYRQKDLQKATPSRVVSLGPDGSVKVLRP